jgi:hypothetical protein
MRDIHGAFMIAVAATEKPGWQTRTVEVWFQRSVRESSFFHLAC